MDRVWIDTKDLQPMGPAPRRSSRPPRPGVASEGTSRRRLACRGMVRAARPVRVHGQTAQSHVTHVQPACRRGSQPSGATSRRRVASFSLPAGRACFPVYEATCGDGGAHRASSLDAPRLPTRSPSCRHSSRCIAHGRASGAGPAAQPAVAGAPLRERQGPDRDWANKASGPSNGLL